MQIENSVDLSIIIPVYNAMPYFRCLLQSIISQKLSGKSFEVIIVDDGSTDGSELYADKISEDFDNVFVFHIDNTGSPAIPRNIGLSAAKGHYVFFADADDVFMPDAFENMLLHAYESNCDVGVFKVDASDWGIEYNGLFEHSIQNATTTDSKLMESLGPTKLFRRELLIKNDLVFPAELPFEDLPFTMACYLAASKIIIVTDMVYYKYVRRKDKLSLSQSPNENKIFSSPELLIKSIEYYFKTASQYCNPAENLPVLLRGFRVAINEILPRIISTASTGLHMARLKDCLKKYYSDKLRSQMPLKMLLLSDSLIYGDTEAAAQIFSYYPDGPQIRFDTDTFGNTTYSIYKPESNIQIMRGAIPGDCGHGLPKLNSPHIFYNRITKACFANDSLFFSGKGEILAKSNGKLERGLLRAVLANSKTRTTVLKLSNVSAQNVYSSVFQYVFDWEGSIKLKELVDLNFDEKKHSIKFFIDIFPSGEDAISNRFGHNRNSGIFNQFIKNAVVYNDFIFTPTETKYKNLTVNIAPVKDMENITIKLELRKKENGIFLFASGESLFDNYKGDTICFEIISRKGKTVYSKLMQKGDRRGNRTFSAEINLTDELAVGTYKLLIRTDLRGYTLFYRDFYLSDNENEAAPEKKYLRLRPFKLRLVDNEISNARLTRCRF